MNFHIDLFVNLIFNTKKTTNMLNLLLLVVGIMNNIKTNQYQNL
jgi:hypothetical protein